MRYTSGLWLYQRYLGRTYFLSRFTYQLLGNKSNCGLKFTAACSMRNK